MNNRIKRHVYIYLLLYLCICQVQGQNPQFSFSRKYKNEKLLIAGCGWRKIAVIDKKTGNPEWEHALGKGEDCNDIELTKEKTFYTPIPQEQDLSLLRKKWFGTTK